MAMKRREVLLAAAAVACTPKAKQEQQQMTTSHRMPVAFVPHGGGPWPIMSLAFPEDERAALSKYLREVSRVAKTRPKALLVISAHWEEHVPTVTSGAKPPLLYDYYGFPPEAYALTWPAPGHPELAARVRELLGAAGFSTGENAERGYDHGTFVPLKLAFPEAEIPVVQLSLIRGLDVNEHLKMGRALAPLRDEGVFIIGSGNSFHNMKAFFGSGSRENAAEFDAWIRTAATSEPSARDEHLRNWAAAPFGRYCHPREEHLIPLMVCAGAACDDRGVTTWTGSYAGLKVSGFHFG